MNWLQKMASPEAWLRSQGIPDEILRYALSNTFPRKIQKWVALQLHQVYQNQVHQKGYNKENHLTAGEIIERNKQNLIEIRDWFNHESAKPAVNVVNPETGEVVIDPNTGKPKRTAFGINNFTIESALKEVDIWQVEMVEVRGDDLKNEGAIMQHCVGDDDQDYRENIERNNVKIFSLRDARGWPHATIEVKNQNAEFDMKDYDNDPGNNIYDEHGELRDQMEIVDSYKERQSEKWNIEQVQGKQNEPPINKYRPFLKTWLGIHPEFNPSENDLLSVTPSPELLQIIMNDKGNLSEEALETGTYRKYFDHLDEEDTVRLMQQVINDQGVGWSDQAISDAITKPVVNGWFDADDADDSAGAAMGEFFRGNDPTVMAKEQYNAFVRSLTSHDSPDIRSSAYSRISVDSYYRTPEGLQEFTQIALQESSAKVVAVILPNFFTYPNKDSKDSMERYRNPLFTPEMFSFAMQLSEKFKGAPDSDELHAKIAVGLAPQADPQMISRAVTNRFIGQRIGDGSTYEVRHALEKMDGSRFGQVWALLDPTLRRFLLFEEIKGYNSMVNKHREVINLYPKEMAFKRENGGLNPPGLGTIFQPQGTEDIESIRPQNTPSSPGVPQRDDLGQALLNQFGPLQSGPPIGFPGREAESNWVKRIAQKSMPLPVTVPNVEQREHAGVSRIDSRMTEETANQLRQQYPGIEYGGAGAIGIVFKMPNKRMKATHDWGEANRAKAVFERPMNWVVSILEEPKMIQEDPPMWGIWMEELHPLTDVQLRKFVTDLERLYERDRFPDLSEVYIKIEEEDIKDTDTAMIIYSQMKYILEMNEQTLGLTDIHGGNVAWDENGNLKVFDLGPGVWP